VVSLAHSFEEDRKLLERAARCTAAIPALNRIDRSSPCRRYARSSSVTSTILWTTSRRTMRGSYSAVKVRAVAGLHASRTATEYLRIARIAVSARSTAGRAQAGLSACSNQRPLQPDNHAQRWLASL
jgi:hypothetical protein